MRFVIMTAALLTAASLIFNSYANGRDNDGRFAGPGQIDPVSGASEVSLIVGDATSVQRQELEKQAR